MINTRWRDVALNRFPFKHTWDALALAKVFARGKVIKNHTLSLQQRLNCVRFYFGADGVRRLLVMLPRSGSHWLELGLAVAMDLAAGGDGEYTYENGLFWPRRGLPSMRFDWRVPTGISQAQHFHSAGENFVARPYFHSRHPYFRLRSAQLKNMKIVLLTRWIPASLESRRFKFAQASRRPEVILENEDSFDWDKNLSSAIQFSNSWGDALTWHRNIRQYKYEDLAADPVAGHKDILDFWGFDVPEDCVRASIKKCTVEEMKKRIPPSQQRDNLRVPDRTKNQRRPLSAERKRYIIDRLNRELIYDLGYKYDNETEYGFEYE